MDLFETATSQIIHHPEYNSTLILRSEVVAEHAPPFPPALPVPALDGYAAAKAVHRKLLPRRPGRDAGLEQLCTMYALDLDPGAPGGPQHGEQISVLVLSPLLAPGTSLPYYHPAVSHLAFRYIPSPSPPGSHGLLSIEVVPLASPSPPPDIALNSRLYRTCLALLDTLHRYGWGALSNYKKRMAHDRIVPREAYQDLYLVMRERHKWRVDEWCEGTDPLKHVFEDIGIATYLMLLWKDTFASATAPTENVEKVNVETFNPFDHQLTLFTSISCGNGLLVHILTAEGYAGHGVDVRARLSWSHYPPATRAALHVHALDPTSPARDPYLAPGVFLIGNHADELSPWVPVLAALSGAAGYLSIPCCAWAFDARFTRSAAKAALFPVPAHDSRFAEELGLGADGNNTSAYAAYRIWLAALSAWCGWEVECDALRIPSTRNWAIVGRRKGGEGEGVENARRIVDEVRNRAVFKTRRPEGKAGDH
ncbi:DUF1613-domain-containing protein [Gloeophyllum trabeum ATCC 11539]|uniref:tRNA (uracil-O(2)-)-methyltransferase n=1 Tax=Gloeophyllum trabeum (strain ATCC 11539 / FP-39264 / Madison 617) TaxID=670483 RepID=S7R7V5_GLOTA|nr:DUF1613-domain-containing protein [Gloeophyllum trabeum ATCC 11539]EPQ50435.1 DUF1613-domain-containing protein [Gloeophyllum trabeum ATCC 11539]